jgi:crotonobetainyl-CoA hydratase
VLGRCVEVGNGAAVASVLVDKRDYVLVLTLNRPEARNAATTEMATIVGNALKVAEHDRSVRAVVITGAGERSFCAGADLAGVARGEPPLHPDHPEWSFLGMVRQPVKTPIIAAVNGFALGGGLEVVLACDVAVAATGATFGMPEVKRGLLAAAGGPLRLPAAVPSKVAMYTMLTGESMDAVTAERWGLVNEVVPASEVLPRAMAIAELIAANGPLAVRATKAVGRAIRDGRFAGEELGWRIIDAELPVVIDSADAVEGPRAFMEKRTPRWTGR